MRTRRRGHMGPRHRRCSSRCPHHSSRCRSGCRSLLRLGTQDRSREGPRCGRLNRSTSNEARVRARVSVRVRAGRGGRRPSPPATRLGSPRRVHQRRDDLESAAACSRSDHPHRLRAGGPRASPSWQVETHGPRRAQHARGRDESRPYPNPCNRNPHPHSAFRTRTRTRIPHSAFRIPHPLPHPLPLPLPQAASRKPQAASRKPLPL